MPKDNSPVRLEDWAERSKKPFTEMTWEERFFWALDEFLKMQSKAEAAEAGRFGRPLLPEPVPFVKAPPNLVRESEASRMRIQKTRLGATYPMPAKLKHFDHATAIA